MDRSLAKETKLTRRKLLRNGVRLGIGAAGLTATSAAWGALVEVDWIEIKRLELKLPRLPRSFDGTRVAQISDIHIEGGDMRRHFPAIAEMVTALKPDLIVLTGDYTTYTDKWQRSLLVDGFKRLAAPLGVFGVLGNHDDPDDVGSRGALLRGGIEELANKSATLKRGGEELILCGVDDWMQGRADLTAVIRQLPPNAGAILLLHEPDFADDVAATGHFDLTLSGHSHGGQIALPVVGPLHLPPYCHKYPRGFYQIGDMAHYTNRGLGTVNIPVRFGARPEITIFTLKSA